MAGRLDEALLLRLVSYGAYAAGTGGVALALGGWPGWLAVALAGAIPGAYLLRDGLENRSIAREIAENAPERFTAPPPRQQRGAGSAPESIAMPPAQ